MNNTSDNNTPPFSSTTSSVSSSDAELRQSLTSLFNKTASGLQFSLYCELLPIELFSVIKFTLVEMLSCPFKINVELASHQPDIDFSQVLDKSVYLSVYQDGQLIRTVNGIVTTFSQGDTGFARSRYSMTIHPPLWRATLRKNSRIFQAQDIQAILQTLMQENHIDKCKYFFQKPHKQREFCVQYNETDLQFISRLIAEEGIFYFFEFEDGQHTVVFTDNPTRLPLVATLPYNRHAQAQQQQQTVYDLYQHEKIAASQVLMKDYTFKNPRWPALFQQDSDALHHQQKIYRHYHYPGRFKDSEHGSDFTQYRIEALRNDTLQNNARSNSFLLHTGCLFNLIEHDRAELNQTWQIISISHTGQQAQSLEEEAGEGITSLSNNFCMIPANQTWRALPQDKPLIEGPQIARVTGPKGEEIYTDRFGRVRVKFMWDLTDTQDDTSSCWIRVSQPWAGNGWGMIAIPRVGQEVIVDFLHGDPDQPIIIGRTYHANNLPSFDLPDAKTQMILRSQTHKGEGFNELRFEDEAGQEGLFLHAQKDMTTQVKDSQLTLIEKGDQQLILQNGNRSVILEKGNETTQIAEGNLVETIKLTRSTQANSIQVTANAEGSNPGQQYYSATDMLQLNVGEGNIVMTKEAITLRFAGSTIQISSEGILLKASNVSINPE